MSAHKGRDAGSLAPRAGDPFAQALPRGSLLRVTSVLALAAALPLAAEMVATRPEVCEQSSPEAGHPLVRSLPASTGGLRGGVGPVFPGRCAAELVAGPPRVRVVLINPFTVWKALEQRAVRWMDGEVDGEVDGGGVRWTVRWTGALPRTGESAIVEQ